MSGLYLQQKGYEVGSNDHPYGERPSPSTYEPPYRDKFQIAPPIIDHALLQTSLRQQQERDAKNKRSENKHDPNTVSPDHFNEAVNLDYWG